MSKQFIFAISLAVLVFNHFQNGAAANEDDSATSGIHVPDGFVVEVAAAAPLVKHPMMATFDDRGRLFIAETAGENLRRDDLEKRLPNFVRMLEDTDDDGVFDKSTTFADKMTFPMGALWHEGSLFVASSGAIWRLTDTDDDGVADERQQIVNEFGYTGNAADVHGCFLGPCGRIYWCEGRHGHEFTDEGGHILSKGKAARVFSCKPDGSDVQVHCGGGMDNPVEIDFLESGEMLGTVNLFYRQRGDCLVHWMHGGVYPRFDQPQVVAEFKRTGDLLGPVVNLGHVAVSGTTRYRGSHFGDEFTDNFFITEFNTHKVVRAKLSRAGSTFAAEVDEFLTSDNPDFHPTDVLQDADGSLLVIDTGGWFRIGCPTSQIAKPNILGAIYRIRRRDQPTVDDPRGKGIDWHDESTQLASLLDDERSTVRDRAKRELAKQGERAVMPLVGSLSSSSVRMRRNAIWTLSRIESDRATQAIRKCLNDEDATVRQAAVVSLGIRRNVKAVADVIQCLADEDTAVRRDAATTLGKLQSKLAVPSILATLGDDSIDRVTEHALIYALIDTNSPDATATGLASENPHVKRAALVALDQMNDGNLQREQVTALLGTSDLALQRAAIDVIARRPEWSAEVVTTAQQLFASDEASDEQFASAKQLLLAFADDESVQAFIASSLEQPASTRVTMTLLEVIRDASLSSPPTAWSTAVANALASNDANIVDAAIAASARFTSSEIESALSSVASDEKRSDDLRVRAIGASSSSDAMNDRLFAFVVGQLVEDTPTTQRLAAVRAIASASLSDKQLLRVTEIVKTASPLELSTLISVYEGNKSELIGSKLLKSLKDSPGLASLSPTAFDRAIASYPKSIQSSAKQLRSQLATSSQEQIERLAKLESQMAGGDPRRGKAVFEGQRTSCVTCHSVAGRGGRIGPDLSTTGERRTVRDILEAVLYPNSSLARGFETFAVLTTTGRVHTGLILSESTDAIRLRTTDQTEVIIRRDEIEELRPSPTSVMPTGLDRTMSHDDLRDLVAYLSSLKG